MIIKGKKIASLVLIMGLLLSSFAFATDTSTLVTPTVPAVVPGGPLEAEEPVIPVGPVDPIDPVDPTGATTPESTENPPSDGEQSIDPMPPVVQEPEPKPEVVLPPVLTEAEKAEIKKQENIRRTKFLKDNKKIIEKNKKIHINTMDQSIKKLEEKYKIRVSGIYVKSLKNDFEYSKNMDLTRYNPTFDRREGFFYSASVVKLFESYSIIKMAINGKVDVKKSYIDPVTKRKLNVDYDLRKMLIISDNDRFASFLRIFGVQKINNTLKANGLKFSKVLGEVFPAIKASDYYNKLRYGTAEQGARITPKETAKLLEMIYLEPDPKMDIIRDSMKKATTGRNRIKRSLDVSRGEMLAHKTGTGRRYNAVNDVGYVLSPDGDYIIVILSMGNSASGIYDVKPGEVDYEVIGERFISNVAKVVHKEMELVHKDPYLKETIFKPFN